MATGPMFLAGLCRVPLLCSGRGTETPPIPHSVPFFSPYRWPGLSSPTICAFFSPSRDLSPLCAPAIISLPMSFGGCLAGPDSGSDSHSLEPFVLFSSMPLSFLLALNRSVKPADAGQGWSSPSFWWLPCFLRMRSPAKRPLLFSPSFSLLVLLPPLFQHGSVNSLFPLE